MLLAGLTGEIALAETVLSASAVRCPTRSDAGRPEATRRKHGCRAASFFISREYLPSLAAISSSGSGPNKLSGSLNAPHHTVGAPSVANWRSIVTTGIFSAMACAASRRSKGSKCSPSNRPASRACAVVKLNIWSWARSQISSNRSANGLAASSLPICTL